MTREGVRLMEKPSAPGPISTVVRCQAVMRVLSITLRNERARERIGWLRGCPHRARADPRRAEIVRRRSAEGGCCVCVRSTIGGERAWGQKRSPRSQESSLKACQKRLDGTVRADTIFVNEAEWPRRVGRRGSSGRCGGIYAGVVLDKIVCLRKNPGKTVISPGHYTGIFTSVSSIPVFRHSRNTIFILRLCTNWLQR